MSWSCASDVGSCGVREYCSRNPGTFQTFRTCRTMFRTFLDMFRTCGQDQHAQAQHWLRQAQLMHAQHWPPTQMRTRHMGANPSLPCLHLGPRLMLSMHELGLPEPMLSLSTLILVTCPEYAQECSEHCSARSERSAPREQGSRQTQDDLAWSVESQYNTSLRYARHALSFMPEWELLT